MPASAKSQGPPWSPHSLDRQLVQGRRAAQARVFARSTARPSQQRPTGRAANAGKPPSRASRSRPTECVRIAVLQRHCQKIGGSCNLTAVFRRRYQEISARCVLIAGLQRHCQRIGGSCDLTAVLQGDCQEIGGSCVLKT